MSVFSARPDLTPTASVALMEAESTMPSPLQRYHQASKKADLRQLDKTLGLRLTTGS